jgi:hypothetical protein
VTQSIGPRTQDSGRRAGGIDDKRAAGRASDCEVKHAARQSCVLMRELDLRALLVMVFVVALPLAMSVESDGDSRCGAARRRLELLRADLIAAELEVQQLCVPDELNASHATFLEQTRTLAQLRAKSALEEGKLAEQDTRLVGSVHRASVTNVSPVIDHGQIVKQRHR